MPDEGFKIASAWVEVEPDTDGFREKLQEQIDAALAGTGATVKVGVDSAELDAGIDDAKAKLADLDGSAAAPTVGIDDDLFDAGIDDAKAKLKDLDGSAAAPSLGLDDDLFDGTADDARAKLDELDGTAAAPTLGLDDTDFQAKLARDKEELAATSGGGSGESGSLVGAITMGVSSMLPGIGGAAAGLSLLGGTGALAFTSIGKALSAHSQASQTAGTTSQQLASTAFSNSVAIQQAQEAAGNAYTQAAQDSTASAEQIESAQMSLTETVRNAAQSQIQAEQAVGQAEHELSDAQFSQQQAQESLTAARVQARLTLQQLNDAEKDAALSVTAARLALAQAQQSQQDTDENAMSTSLDKQEAALAVAQAQQQLVEAQQNVTSSTAAANLANKQGVDGSQAVQQAKEAEKDAVYAVAQAEQQAADAQRTLTDTELNNADAIKAAQLSVTQAQQQAAATQERDAQAISDAQRNLTDTYKEQKLAAAATASTSNSAAGQFAADMARMSPSARRFTNELLGMRGAWHRLQSGAQAAVLPGMTVFLAGISKDLPVVDKAVESMGGVISRAFGSMGKELGSAGGQNVLSGLLTNGTKFVTTVLPPFGRFVADLAKVGAAPGAQSGLANLIAGIGRGLTGLATSIAPYTKQINEFLDAAGHIVAAIGPSLGRMIGLIAKTIGPLTRYLDRHPDGTVVKVLADIAAGLLTLKGLQKVLPDFITGPLGKLGGKLASQAGKWGGQIVTGLGSKLLGGLKSMAGSVWESMEGPLGTAAGTVARWGGQFVGQIGSMAGSAARFAVQIGEQLAETAGETAAWVAEHAIAAGSFIAENVTMAASATAAYIAENAASLGIIAGITLLVAAIVFLATHWSEVWGDVQSIALDVWHNVLDPMWHGIETGATDLYDDTLRPVFTSIGKLLTDAKNLALDLWHDGFDPVWKGIKSGARDFVSVFQTVWGKLEGVFKTPVNFLIGTVYDKGIARLWNDVVEHIGLGSIKLPVIAKLAAGGKLPGYGGGDVHPALLEAGETVVDKDRSRKLAPVFAAAGVPGYSGGGLIGGFLGDVASDLFSGVKFAAEFAADPAKAITSALASVLHTPATGDLARVMNAIPKSIITSLAKVVGLSGSGSGGGVPGGSSGAVGALPANWKTITGYLAANGFTRFAAAGVAGNIDAESGGNPEILEIGGGGGGGLIQWTPYPSGYITGDVTRDLATQLRAILSWGGGPALVNKATSPSNAALIYQDDYERPASDTASIGQRMASANAVYQAMGWGKPSGVATRYDSGGWLMPNTIPVNQTGRPEAVLTPAQSTALTALAEAAVRNGGTGGGERVVVNQNYLGTQWPTPEQKAMQRRDLALALGGG